MIRRTALGALAGAATIPFLARGAWAQTASMPSDPMQLRAMGLAGSAFAMQTSEMALQQATRPDVRQFAQFEAAEQRALMEAMRVGGVDVPAQVTMDARKSQMLQQLRAAQGPAFDRAYIEGQVMGHQELLQIHQTMARSAPTPVERALSTLAVASIQQHLVMLQGLQNDTGALTGGGGRSTR